jgi:hypothetical protein
MRHGSGLGGKNIMTRNHKLVVPVIIAAALWLVPWLKSDSQIRKLGDDDWARLKQGKLVKEVKREGGTQSMGSSAGLFDYPPELIWKVICALELYDKYMARTTKSVLLDEQAKNRVIAAGDKSAEEVEKLFAGMKPGYVRKDPDGKWTVYSYQRNSFPWPVNDRWVLLEISHDDKTFTQNWHRLAGNIKQDFGTWHLEPMPGNPGQTVGFLEIHIDLNLPATGPFTAFAMDVTLPNTYKDFTNMAKDFSKK